MYMYVVTVYYCGVTSDTNANELHEDLQGVLELIQVLVGVMAELYQEVWDEVMGFDCVVRPRAHSQ